MLLHKLRLAFLWVPILILGLAAAPCLAQDAPQEVTFRRMAVAPFFVGQRQPDLDENRDQTLSCPIDQICIEDPAIPPRAGRIMTSLVEQQLRDRFGQRVVPLPQVRAAIDQIRLNKASDTPRSLALELHKVLNVDLVLVGMVWRYRERGAILGVPDSPASLAFALYLIDAKSGVQLWRGLFDGTQKTVLENLLHARKQLKMGLKWLSADELAQHGVQEVFDQFPVNVQPKDQTGPNN